VDTAEAAHDFQPPLFVDIRFSRSVRAPGFRDKAFADLLGDRYVWMRDLGNRGIQTGTLEIVNPAAAEELLARAREAARDRRRVLFFCACEWPRWEGRLNCHRDEVAGLVLAAARRRNLAAQVVEWPGGEPVSAELEVSPGVLQTVRRGRGTVPLGQQLPPQFAGLPWMSAATLRAGGDSLAILTGPARFKKEWVLPVLVCGGPDDDAATPQGDARRARRFLGLEARTTWEVACG
jgi:hypothetical protein